MRERLAVAVRAQCLQRAGPNGEAEAPAVCGQHPEARAEVGWGVVLVKGVSFSFDRCELSLPGGLRLLLGPRLLFGGATPSCPRWPQAWRSGALRHAQGRGVGSGRPPHGWLCGARGAQRVPTMAVTFGLAQWRPRQGVHSLGGGRRAQ